MSRVRCIVESVAPPARLTALSRTVDRGRQHLAGYGRPLGDIQHPEFVALQRPFAQKCSPPKLRQGAVAAPGFFSGTLISRHWLAVFRSATA